MRKRLDGAHLGLWLILILEFLAFSGSIDKFFNHDSLFYLIHAPRSWDQLVAVMAGPDPVQQYRPMTLAVMGLMLPFFGLDHVLYHYVPIAFHLLNTVLIWMLARRLLSSPIGALVATAFWGLHSAAAYVAYDIGYFPDFLMTSFAISSLIFAIDSFRDGSRFKAALALLIYLFALLSKEAMLAFPAAVLVSLVLAAISQPWGSNPVGPGSGYGVLPAGKETGLCPHFSWQQLISLVRKALPLTGAYLALALIHAARLFYWLQSDRLYPQGANPAYQIGPLDNLVEKARYLFWTFNLPGQLAIPHPNRNRALALLLMGLIFLVWLLNFLWRRGRLVAAEIGGMAWLAAMLVPVCLLSNRTEKWYVYVPAIGLALALGAGCSRWDGFKWPLPARLAGPAFFGLFLTAMYFASSVQIQDVLNSSNSAYASDVVENCLKDIDSLHPSLPSNATLFLLRTHETNVAEFFGDGRILPLYYPEKRIRMMFADKGDELPRDFAARDDLRILRYLYGHLYDATGYYKGRRFDPKSRSLARDLSVLDVSVNRNEFYPDYNRFATPGGTPAFFATPDRDILTQIGGSIVTVPLGEVPPETSLRFEISWMHDQGDGAYAELKIRAAGEEEVLLRRYMQPNQEGEGLQWEEVVLDIGAYAGKKADLVLTCFNKAGGSTIADWLNWRDIQIVSPHLVDERIGM
jgi:hypothetical protein